MIRHPLSKIKIKKAVRSFLRTYLQREKFKNTKKREEKMAKERSFFGPFFVLHQSTYFLQLPGTLTPNIFTIVINKMLVKGLNFKASSTCNSGNTKGGSIPVPLTPCLTGLESAVWQLTIFDFICKTDWSKPVKQEVNGTVILPPLVFPV